MLFVTVPKAHIIIIIITITIIIIIIIMMMMMMMMMVSSVMSRISPAHGTSVFDLRVTFL